MIRGLQPGISTMDGWGLNMFTDDELTEIHLATLDILQNYGVGVHCDDRHRHFRERRSSCGPGEQSCKDTPTSGGRCH